MYGTGTYGARRNRTFEHVRAGPSVSTDTACSSSLVSAHQAHKSLVGEETVAALAGGVNTMLLAVTTTSICGLGALSPNARCKTFDVTADGYGRGEGFGVIVLGPTSAVTDIGPNHGALALVRASAINQDGRSSGLTAPNGPSQGTLVLAALSMGNITSSDVGYIATHGTGRRLARNCCLEGLSKQIS